MAKWSNIKTAGILKILLELGSSGDICHSGDDTCSSDTIPVAGVNAAGKLQFNAEAAVRASRVWQDLFADEEMRIVQCEEFLTEHEARSLARVHMNIISKSRAPIVCGDVHMIARLAPGSAQEIRNFGTSCMNESASAKYAPTLLKYVTFSTAFYSGDIGFTDTFDRRVGALFPLLRPQLGGRFQVTSHPNGRGYGLHHDCSNKTVDRAATVLVYLADARGGETKFPSLGLSVQPARGRAVVWNSMSQTGRCLPSSVHMAARVQKGRKFTLQRWYYSASPDGLGQPHRQPLLPNRAPDVPVLLCDGEEDLNVGELLPTCRWYDEWTLEHLVLPIAGGWRKTLAPGEVHVVEGFLSTEQIRAIRGRVRNIGLHTVMVNQGMMRRVRSRKSLLEDNEVSNVLLGIAEYANQHLHLQQSVAEYNGFVVPHAAEFYQYVPLDKVMSSRKAAAQGVKKSGAAAHTDTDFYGRCLSAALHLHSPRKGGEFVLHRCPLADCHALRGNKLQRAYDTNAFDNADDLRIVDTVEGRLVFFLAENIHSVRDILEGTRELLFLWMTCDLQDAWLAKGRGREML